MKLSILFENFFIKRPQSVEQLLADCVQKSCIVTFLNPYTIFTSAKWNIDFDQFDYICSDAMFPVLLERFWGYKGRSRISFDLGSFAENLFAFASEHSKKIFFWGTTDDNLKSATVFFEKQFPGMKIVGAENGFHTPQEDSEIIEQILQKCPDFVIIGQGVPKQDLLVLALKNAGFKGAAFTCGGFLHQTAMSANGYYYPEWINRWNLRTPYRLCKEHYVLKRLFLYYIPFLFQYSYFLLCRRVKGG